MRQTKADADENSKFVLKDRRKVGKRALIDCNYSTKLHLGSGEHGLWFTRKLFITLSFKLGGVQGDCDRSKDQY